MESGSVRRDADSGMTRFSNKDLLQLFVPLIIEQFLEYVVGLSDSIMVSHVG